MKKALGHRGKFLAAKTTEIDERIQTIKHRQLLLKEAEQELLKRAEALAERERKVRADADKVVVLEAERDALERRLEMIEERKALQNMAPIRGRTLDSENTSYQP